MTTIGIIGGGKAAALHAQAALMCRRTKLVGVGGGASSAGWLAAEADVPDLGFDAMADRADAIVIAVPPAAAGDLVASLVGRVGAILVEAPVSPNLPEPACPAMVGANLLHAPLVRQALHAISEMDSPHHLDLRSSQPPPSWGTHGTPAFGGAGMDPGARYAPVLLAAAGEAAVAATAEVVPGKLDEVEAEAVFHLTLESGRTVTLGSRWAPGEARVDLEAADRGAVVALSFFPAPTLELNGSAVDAEPSHPLVALGFVAQIERLAAVCADSTTPWLDLAAGRALTGLLCSALRGGGSH